MSIETRRGTWTTLVGASLLASCASASYRKPIVAVPASFNSYPAVGAEKALDEWWLLFRDDQLTSLITGALRNAPDARTALAVLDEARAARSETLTRYSPTGGASVSAGVQSIRVPNVPTSTQTVFSGSFAPSWELGLFGRRAALQRTAEADLDAARFQYEASRQSLATNVAGNLFEARGYAVRLAQARQTLRLASELARVGERRLEVGIGSRADAASLQADEATAQAAVRSLQAQLEISRRSLLVLLGRGTAQVSTLPIEATLQEAPAVPAITPASLLSRRPDIRQAEARVRSAAGNLKLDTLALLPSISLAPAISFTPLAGSSGHTTTATAGPGLVLPLFDRTRIHAQIRGQRARTEQAVIAYENSIQAGFAEAQNMLSQYAFDTARLSELSLAEERARFAFDAQRAGYQAGVVDITTLIQSERTWRTNLAALSDLRATTLIDAVNVFRALGGGWSPDEQAQSTASPIERSPQ